MPEREIEELLANLPRRALAVEQEQQVLEAILGARGPAPALWRRLIPLWQTAAACLATAAVTMAAMLLRSPTVATRESDEAPRVALVRLDSWPTASTPDRHTMDIRAWRVLASAEGDGTR